MKRNTFFEYKRIIRLFGIFGLFSTLLFTSCDGIQTDEIDENTESSSLNYTVSFALANLVGESSEEVERTIYPDQINVDGLSFWLKGTPVKKTGTDDEGEPIWDEESGDNKRSTDDASKDLLTGIKYPVKEELDKASFNLDAGAWQFELKAYDNVEYRKKENGEYTYPKEEAYEEKYLRFESITIVPEIKVGKNTIKFNMKLAEEIPSAFKKGSIDIILDCYLGKKTCSEISKVTASLIGISDPSFNATDDCNGETFTETTYVFDNKPDTEETCVNNFTFTNDLAKDADNEEYRRITYKTNKIPKGIYDLSFDITLKYGDEESNVTVTPYTSVVYVETGSISSLNKKLDKFKQRYTIKYKTVEVSYNEVSQENVYLVKDFPSEYFKEAVVSEYNPSSKKPVELPTISSMQRGDKVFLNWYEFDTDTNTFGKKVESFNPNDTTLGTKVFYAKWRDLDIYVSENAPADGRDGSEASPFSTLNEAISYIATPAHKNESLKWTIYIMGSVTAGITIESGGNTPVLAGKITITGYKQKGMSDNWDGADTLFSKSTDPVLKVNTDFPVELSYLTIQHEEGAEGRGLQLGDTNNDPNINITLDNVKVCDNKFQGTGGSGAGIYNQLNLTLKECEISGNTAAEISNQGGAGGGIFNRCELSLIDCLIKSNRAGDKGGGIYNSGTLTIKNCTISGNKSVTGGGVQNEKTMTISNSTFNGNTVDKKDSDTPCGGAIHIASERSAECTAEIDNTIFINNTALEGYGGAISMKSSGNTSTITLKENVKIGGEKGKGNTAIYGGGIYTAGSYSNGPSTTSFEITGENVDISWNNAVKGAGIYLEYAKLDMESGSISNNTAESTTDNPGEGGGISAYNVTATLKGTISNNTAPNGAGLYSYDSSITLTGSINNNTATENGGGIYFKKGAYSSADNISITLSKAASVYENTANNGGGLYCISNHSNPPVFAMNGGTVRGNTASENGGGVYIVGGADTKKFTFNMADGNISGNTASTNGGGVYIGQYGEMFMYGSAVVGELKDSVASKNNHSNSVVDADGKAAGNGGGIYNAGELYIGYTDSNTPAQGEISYNGGIAYNYAKNGAGVFNIATLKMAAGLVSCNYASANGGGVNAATSSTFEFAGGMVSKNNAGSGGGIYNAGTTSLTGEAVVGNGEADSNASSTSYSNKATLGGGINNSSDATLNMEETCKIYFNYASDGGGVYNAGIFNNTGYDDTEKAHLNVKFNKASNSNDEEEDNRDDVYNPD